MLFFRVPYFSVIREKETAIIVKPNGTVPPKLPCGNKKRVLGRKMNGSIFFFKTIRWIVFIVILRQNIILIRIKIVPKINPDS